MRNIDISLLTVLLTCSLMLSPLTFKTSASPDPPKIYLAPSTNTFYSNTTNVGHRFNVTVWCANVTEDILGVQVTLHFNDSVVNVTRWWAPDWDTDFFMPAPVSVIPTPPNNVGYIHVGAGQGYVKVAVMKGGLPPVAPWGHNGTIAILEFNITAAPLEGGQLTSALHINNIDTYLKDTSNVDIPGVAKEDGYYEISKLAVVYYLTVSHTIGGTTAPVPGEHFYENGTTVLVTATNNSGYIFYHWTLDSVNIGATNPVNVVMDSNHTLKAVFKAVGSEGDVNGDGIVDLDDFLSVAFSFGTYGPDFLYPGSLAHPKWDPVNDLNTNNMCDLLDLYTVARNYGKVYV